MSSKPREMWFSGGMEAAVNVEREQAAARRADRVDLKRDDGRFGEGDAEDALVHFGLMNVS